MATMHVSDSEFESSVLQSDDITLVDFWAEWCGPCKQLSPILDTIAEEKSGQIKVAKVNIDDNPETPTKYGVRGIPTMIMFKNGEPIATKVGSVPKSKLDEWIDSVLAA